MAKPDTSEVSEEEYESLFNEDGPLEEAPADEDDSGDEDTENEEEQEEEAEASDQDEEEGEESEEEEEPEASNWEEAPEALRTEHNSVVAERDRWKRDYGKLQSRFTERVNAFKEDEKILPQLRQKSEALDRWNSLLGQYPQLQQSIEREVARLQNPMNAVSIPKELQQDPAVQHLYQAFGPVIQGLQNQLRAAEAKASRIDEWEGKSQEQQARARLDGLLDEAKSEIKSMFGRDASEQEVTQVLKYMTEKNYFESGATAAFAVFKDQYRKQSAKSAANQAKEKAKKFPMRKRGIAPSGRKSKDAESPEEALSMAFADQGFGT